MLMKISSALLTVTYGLTETCDSSGCGLTQHELELAEEQEAVNARTELLQTKLSMESKHASLDPPHPPIGACLPLENHGDHVTLKGSVGTPPQLIEMMLNTGNAYVMVDDCYMSSDTWHLFAPQCFDRTESSSYSNSSVKSFKTQDSGTQYYVEVGSEDLNLGGLVFRLQDSLLMITKKDSEQPAPWSGTFGLGPPTKTRKEGVHSFFDSDANLPAFGLCYHWHGAGVLRAHDGVMQNPLATFGQDNWALGIGSVFAGRGKMDFCMTGEFQKEEGCIANIDSGSSNIVGPQQQFFPLVERMCREWDRCAARVNETHESGINAFFDLVWSCEDWLNESELSEVPPLFFEVTGRQTGSEQLVLSPYSWIVKRSWLDFNLIWKNIAGFNVPLPTYRKKTFCSPSFELEPVDAPKPRWTLGSPVFFQYNVIHDVKNNLLGFESGCEECASRSSTSTTSLAQKPKQRFVSGPTRSPSV